MRVMFVDDEAQVLKGITRMLECADVEWDIEIAHSGPEALDSMKVEPVDVLVTDMQMPGMDGAELLDRVSQLYPNTVRIILSGQASKEAVYRAVKPMHQYLAKPCEAGVLRTTVARACALREVLDSTKSHEFLGRISSLPSLPSLYEEAVAELESPDGTVARAGEIIAQDPAMTAKVLQIANSAIFGLRDPVTSPEKGASVIGMSSLKSLVLSLGVFTSFDGAEIPGFSIDEILDHSLRVAKIAQSIATSQGFDKASADEAFTAGLLHDIGKLILAANAPQEFAASLATSLAQGIPLVEAEQQIMGIGHDKVGSYLLTLWGIPQNIVEAVAFHHCPDQCRGERLNVPALVYVANFLALDEQRKATKEVEQHCRDLLTSAGLVELLDSWRGAICINGE